MRLSSAGFGISWKAVKVVRDPRPKFFRQTSLLQFFSVVEPVQEPEEEEDDSFIVAEEPLDLAEEESPILAPNLFEEYEEDGNEEDDGEFYVNFKDFEEELSFLRKDD